MANPVKLHSRTVTLHRRINELANVSELDNVVISIIDFSFSVRPNIDPFTYTFSRPVKVGLKPRAKRDKRADSTANFYKPSICLN